MKNIIFIVIVFASFSNLTAQVNETAEPLLNQLSIWKPVTLEQLALDIQNKSKNPSTDQLLRNPSATADNTAIIEQVGNENISILTQSGSGNVNFILQTGNSNEYYGDIYGEDNITNAEQIGNDNYIRQLITIDNSQFLLIQHGNYNEIIQEEISGTGRQYEVTQTGNAMRIYILNGNFYR